MPNREFPFSDSSIFTRYGRVGTPQIIVSSRAGDIKSNSPPLPMATSRKYRKKIETTVRKANL